MNSLTLFGLVAVSLMLVTYALEAKSHWFTLLFAGSCALGSTYGFLQGAWPFGLVEGVWAIVAVVKWRGVMTVRAMVKDAPPPPPRQPLA